MSYSGEIQAAGVSALAVYAARAVSRAATAGIRAARERAQKKAVRQMQSRLAVLTRDAAAVRDRLARELGTAAVQAYADHSRTLAALTAACEQSFDTDAFLKQCDASRAALRREIDEKRLLLEAGAIAEIRETMRRSQTLLRRERQEMLASVSRITEDMQNHMQAVELARCIILETQDMIADLRDTYGASRIGSQAADLCREMLSRAETLADEELPEAALTAACAAQDAVLMRVTELMTAECRTHQLCGEVQTALVTAQTLLQEREGDFCFTNTRSGQPAEKHISDVPHYFRGAWEPLAEELSGYAAVFAGVQPCDHDPQVLTDLLDRLDDWQSRFAREYALACERISSEQLRLETGRLLAERYMKQGYRLLPLTADERVLSPLDALVIRLENPDTGDRLELRLNAVPDAAGHIAMQIIVDDHTAYPGTDTEIEAARQAVREENCEAIRHSGIGQGIQLRQRCRNPGVRDGFQKR